MSLDLIRQMKFFGEARRANTLVDRPKIVTSSLSGSNMKICSFCIIEVSTYVLGGGGGELLNESDGDARRLA